MGLRPREKDSRWGGGFPQEKVTEADFRLLENGVISSGWEVAGVRVSDEFGGGYGPSSVRAGETNPPEGHVATFEFRGGFSPDTARKFKFDFAKIANFAADETCNFSGLPVTARGAAFAPVEASLQGLTLKVMEVRRGSLRIRLEPAPNDISYRLVKVIDDQGRELKQNSSGGGGTPTSVTYSYQLEMPKDSKTVDLTFAVTRKQSVEFMAKPEAADVSEAPKN